jgi:hypothetical protein
MKYDLCKLEHRSASSYLCPDADGGGCYGRSCQCEALGPLIHTCVLLNYIVNIYKQGNLYLEIYRVRHKSVNTPFPMNGLSYGDVHPMRVPQIPLYTASQVRMTSRSWDKGVLTDLCLKGVLTDLCLTLYFHVSTECTII